MVEKMVEKSHIRKFVIAGGVVGFVVLLLLLLPFLVDFSHLKPQIQSAVGNAVNARIDFKSARLTLFPSIGIKISDVVIENTDDEFKGTTLFSVQSAIIDTKLIPLFSGKVVGNVSIKNPEFNLARKGLKNNLTALAKPQAAPSESTPAPATQPSPTLTPKDARSQGDTMTMIREKILVEAIVIEHANFSITDLGSTEAQTKSPVKIRDLNIKVSNIGLDRDISILIESQIDINEAGAVVKGPLKMDKIVRVTMGGSGLEKATFSGKLSYDALSIKFKDAFHKASGIPLNIAFNGAFVPNDFSLQAFNLQFHNLLVSTTAHVVNFSDPRLSVTMKATNENLASLGDVLPQHKSMLMNGKLSLNSSVEGQISALNTLAVALDFSTQLTGTDLAVKLDAKGVKPFHGRLNVNSQKIDVDALMKPFMKPVEQTATDTKAKDKAAEADKKTASESGKVADQPPAASTTPAKDFELTQEQRDLLAGTDAEIRVDLKEIQYNSLKLSNIKLDVDQKELVSTLRDFNIDGFSGKIAATGKVNLGEKPIGFDGGFKMLNIHPEEVMAVVKPEHKNVLVGQMNLDLAVKGQGTTVPTLNKNLNGSGSFKFNEGQLNTPSIAAKMQEQFDKLVETFSVSSLGDSIFSGAKKLLDNPLVKASGKAPDLDKLKEQYATLGRVKLGSKASTSKDLKNLTGRIEIKDGRVYISSVRADEDGTMDIKSFVDLELNLGGGGVFTASDATKKRLLAQSQYADLLMDDKSNFTINLGLSGTVTDPGVKISSDSIRQSFETKGRALLEKEVRQAAENYIKNLLGGGSAKDDAKAKAQAEASKKANEAKEKAKVEAEKQKSKAKDALKGLLGR
jgi:hypothetical protein